MYKLPHPLDRPGQLEAFQWLLENDKQYLIICSPPGSGKSAWAAEMSRHYKTMVLTQTRSLQSENYAGIYGFDDLYGKASYPCEDDENEVARLAKWTAYDCQRTDCQCRYQMQERYCLQSARVSLNYAKYLMSRPFVSAASPQVLFLDEGHGLPDIVSNFIGITAYWDNEFIKLKRKPSEESQISYYEAMGYLRNCYRGILNNKVDKRKKLKKWRQWKMLKQKIEITGKILGNSKPENWYFEVDEKKLTIKPLTAKYHFKQLFNAPKIVMMSGTIKPSIAERLGIENDEFDFYQVPQIWPTPTRLIYDLQSPAIKYPYPEKDMAKQAKLISEVLESGKSGIIHVMSKRQAHDLKKRLIAQCDNQIVFHVPSEHLGTDGRLDEWYRTRERKEFSERGIYCISWCFHEGVNLPDESINIMAKTPFPSIGGNYEYARMEHDKSWYYESTAYGIEQLFGRHQRGVKEHYSGNKKSYIADSSWHRVKDYLSEDFRKRIRNYNGL